MSIRHRLSKEEMKKEGFTHYGWMFGFVPIYVSNPYTSSAPNVTTRNWIPDFILDLGEAIHDTTLMFLPPDHILQSYFFIKVTGKIDYEK